MITPHPKYTEKISDYMLWHDLVTGGKCVENQGTRHNYNTGVSYLIQSPYESNQQFSIRLWLATYRNYAMPIVSVFSSAVWRRPPVRTLPDILWDMFDNIDLNNTNADVYFQFIDRKIATYGVYHTFVDMPTIDGPITVYEQKNSGIRPYFIPVSPIDLIRWSYTNSLDYAVIQTQHEKNNSPFEDITYYEQYRLLYKDQWQIYDNKDNKFQLKSEGLYKLNQVPIVSGYFEKVEDMIGNSCIDPISSICLHSFRLGNILDKSMYDTAFPLQLFKGFSLEEIETFIRSSNNGLVGAENCDSRYIESTGQSYAALRESIKQDSADIKEIVLRMLRSDSKVGVSADSKKEDRRQLDSMLIRFAYECESFETKCWNMALDWLGKPELKKEVSIKYNKDFDLDAISSEVIQLMYQLRISNDISRKTFFEVLKKGEVPLPEDFDIEGESAIIEDEMRYITPVMVQENIKGKEDKNAVED